MELFIVTQRNIGTGDETDVWPEAYKTREIAYKEIRKFVIETLLDPETMDDYDMEAAEAALDDVACLTKGEDEIYIDEFEWAIRISKVSY